MNTTKAKVKAFFLNCPIPNKTTEDTKLNTVNIYKHSLIY